MAKEAFDYIGSSRNEDYESGAGTAEYILSSPWELDIRPSNVIIRKHSTLRPGDLFTGEVAPARPLLSGTLFPMTLRLLMVSLVLLLMIIALTLVDLKPILARKVSVPLDQALDLPTVLASATLPSSGKTTSEYSPSELLGVLLDDQTSVDNLIDALEMAAIQRIPGLAEAGAKLLDHDSPEVRTVALSTLATTKDRRVLPAVLLRLDDIDSVVRLEAARALAHVGDRSAVDFLTYRYVVEKDEKIKDALNESLGHLSGLPIPR